MGEISIRPEEILRELENIKSAVSDIETGMASVTEFSSGTVLSEISDLYSFFSEKVKNYCGFLADDLLRTADAFITMEETDIQTGRGIEGK